MSELSIGFIGFGEAARVFSQHLSAAQPRTIRVYCAGRTNRPPYSDAFRADVAAAGASPVDRLADLCAACDVVVSAVVVAHALEVAQAAAAALRPGALYVDISASTPSRKRLMAAAVEGSGALYVDANLMGSVSIYGPTVLLYSSGSGAARFADLFRPMGLAIEVATDRAGDAALVKMLRSVVTKGIEALVVEALTIATLEGVREEVMEGLFESMDRTKFSDFTRMCVLTDVLHAERRADEMDDIAADIRSMVLEPIMTAATARRLRASAAFGLREAFAGREAGVAEVLDAYAAKLAAHRNAANPAPAGRPVM